MQHDVGGEMNGAPLRPAAPGTSEDLPHSRKSAANGSRTVQFGISPGTVITLVLVAASAWLLIRLAHVFLVIVVALLVVGTMSPFVRWLESHRVRRGLAIAFVFFLVFVAVVGIVALTVPSVVAQAGAMIEREPAFRIGLADRLTFFFRPYRRSSPRLPAVRRPQPLSSY